VAPAAPAAATLLPDNHQAARSDRAVTATTTDEHRHKKNKEHKHKKEKKEKRDKKDKKEKREKHEEKGKDGAGDRKHGDKVRRDPMKAILGSLLVHKCVSCH
jgi:hypothetical protein